MNDTLPSGYKLSYKTQRRHASLYVLNTGSQKCIAGYGWGPGVRDHYLIHHVVSGKGTYTLPHKTHAVGAGATFIAYPGDTIAYCADTHDPWEYIWVGFNGTDVRFLLEQTDFSAAMPVLTSDKDGRLKQLLLDIYDCRGNQPFESVRMTGRLYMLLSYLMEISESRAYAEEPTLTYVTRAAAYVSDNYAQPITVDDMSSYAGVSRSWLFRSFKQHLSASPVAYLNSFRIERASILLQNTGLNIKEVACSVGFEDALYFSRVFKKMTGLSPKAYADKHRKRT